MLSIAGSLGVVGSQLSTSKVSPETPKAPGRVNVRLALGTWTLPRGMCPFPITWSSCAQCRGDRAPGGLVCELRVREHRAEA